MYPHEENIKNKIKKNYNNIGDSIQEFYDTHYLPFKNSIEKLQLDEEHRENFTLFTNLVNVYYEQVLNFKNENNIKTQSKFDSSFLEEINCYLFKSLPEITSGKYQFFNKKVYAGLRIDSQDKIVVDKKDVDFCIGKKIKIRIENQDKIELIKPVVAIEVKTYMDATMFGEIKSSSRSIRMATLNCKTYVLMAYKNIADEHLIMAKYDNAVNNIFVLKTDETASIDDNAIYEFWKEIKNAVSSFETNDIISVPGKLF